MKMNNTPLVSVILPTYNRAELIPRAIDSVLTQTYANWELIIWDDGSIDDTEKIVRSYNDDRIKYCYEENHGVSYARNKAISISGGEYVAFLDSDDEWVGEKLAVQVEVMNTNSQIDVLFSDYIDIIESIQKKYRTFEQYSNVMKLLELEKVDSSLFVIKRGIPEILSFENFIATDSVIFRRKLLERTGPFLESLQGPEDFELWWRMGIEGACFAFVDKVFLTRFKPEGSLSSPGILSFENVIKGLDICLQKTLSKERGDLVPYLNINYRNTWQNLIPLYAAKGERKKMLNAFIQSLRYGFSLGSFRLLLEAIIGQKVLRESVYPIIWFKKGKEEWR